MKSKKNGKSPKSSTSIAKPQRQSSRPPASDRFVNTNAQFDAVTRTPDTVARRVEKRTEWIGSVALVTGPGAPIRTLDLNPALSYFPWLCRIARGYEYHRIIKMSVEYRPSCSTTSTGVVTMAFDYDPNDFAPRTRQDLSAYAGAASAAVRLPFSIEYRERDTGGGAKIRACRSNIYSDWGSQTVPASASPDLLLSDFGTLYVWSSDASASGTAGDLYVSYEWELHTPQQGSTQVTAQYMRVVSGVGSSYAWFGNGAFFPEFFQTGFDVTPTGTVLVGQSGTANGFNLFFPNPGEYVCHLRIQGTGMDDDDDISAAVDAYTYIRPRMVDNSVSTSPITNNGTATLYSVGDSSISLATHQEWNFRVRITRPSGIVFNTTSVIAGSRAGTILSVMEYPFEIQNALL